MSIPEHFGSYYLTHNILDFYIDTIQLGLEGAHNTQGKGLLC